MKTQNSLMGSIANFLVFNLILGPTANAALSTDAASAITFYRNKNSMFASGQTSRDTLESQLLKIEEEAAYRVKWDQKTYTLRAENLIRDIEVALVVDLKNPQKLFTNPDAEKADGPLLSAHAQLTIHEVQDFWARVSLDGKKSLGWIALEQLKSRHNDKGVYVNFIETALREKPHSGSHRLALIESRKRFIPLGFEGSFIKLRYNNQIGYAEMSHFVSRADFATLAYHPKKNWVAVLHRNNNSIITQSGETLAVEDITGYVTSATKAVVASADTSLNYSPPARAHVEIEEVRAFTWAQSRIKEHGDVWWKKSDLGEVQRTIASKNDDVLTTEDLLKKEIFSIAFESKDSLRGLVSCEGIYRSEDGKTWKKIPQFGQQNYPVSIHPNGTWFVGSFKSADYGRTYSPFIRWDRIAKAIENSKVITHPRYLKLTEIKPMPHSRVQISIDTGVMKVHLESLIGDINWSVVR